MDTIFWKNFGGIVVEGNLAYKKLKPKAKKYLLLPSLRVLLRANT